MYIYEWLRLRVSYCICTTDQQSNGAYTFQPFSPSVTHIKSSNERTKNITFASNPIPYRKLTACTYNAHQSHTEPEQHEYIGNEKIQENLSMMYLYHIYTYVNVISKCWKWYYFVFFLLFFFFLRNHFIAAVLNALLLLPLPLHSLLIIHPYNTYNGIGIRVAVRHSTFGHTKPYFFFFLLAVCIRANDAWWNKGSFDYYILENRKLRKMLK